MAVDTNEVEVRNNPEKRRFEVSLGDKLATVNYLIAGKTIIFTHTEVPPEFEGMGVASKMAQVALDFAKSQEYRVQARCPFIAAYIRRHPEYQPITQGY